MKTQKELEEMAARWNELQHQKKIELSQAQKGQIKECTKIKELKFYKKPFYQMIDEN